MSETPRDLLSLPPNLPIPTDDGSARHLFGSCVPRIPLRSTDGDRIDLGSMPGTVVVFAYPRTGLPNQPPLGADWDLIPGVRGCTPQACSFRDSWTELQGFATRVFGLSTQDTEYQTELVTRLALPYPILSDTNLEFATALSLPTHVFPGHTLLRRLAWVQRDGVIHRVFYPVFRSDRSALDVLEWLRSAPD
jgi:peroxiredoxin (alkyl hydroperoxide reductase subunit C)